MNWWSTLDRKAELRRTAGLTRTLRPRPVDDPLIDLAGNDYLGLSRHKLVVSVAAQTMEAFGLGAGGSRLVHGSTDAHTSLETRLSELLGGPGLVYSSGYLANLAAVRAMCHKSTLLIHDAHVHASIIDGCALAGVTTAIMPHSDTSALAAMLAGHDGKAVVAVESIYSVDGDAAPLRRLYEVCRAHKALLLVDEAHAVGVLGPDGAGAVAQAGLTGAEDLVITATLSKALGAAGGVIAGPPELRRHLIDTSRQFIFDTALPPSTAAGALAAVELAAADPRLRAEVTERSAWAAAELGVAVPAGGVIAVPASGAAEAVTWSDRCRDNGVAVGCFRPPSTPDSTSRLRLTVNAAIPRDDFTRAIDVVKRERP